MRFLRGAGPPGAREWIQHASNAAPYGGQFRRQLVSRGRTESAAHTSISFAPTWTGLLRGMASPMWAGVSDARGRQRPAKLPNPATALHSETWFLTGNAAGHTVS